MGERLPFKKGDEVWVKATVQDFYGGALHAGWVDVSFEGRDDITTVETSIVRPAGLDIDEAFGGMPAGTVEVTRERYFEIPEDRRAVMRTQVRDFGGEIFGETIRYFEVTSRG